MITNQTTQSILPNDVDVSIDTLKKLLSEAQTVTALFATWTGTWKSLEKDQLVTTPYYLKWADVATLAINNINPVIDKDNRKKLAEDLITIIIVPLKGMIQAIQMYSKKNNVQVPELSSPPDDIFEFKKWAIEYISSTVKLIKVTGDK